MERTAIHRIKQRIFYYTYGPNEPALTVKSGERVVAKTRDARGYDENMAAIPYSQKQRSDTTSFREANPLIGPIYVEEAAPGDRLVVSIEKIRLNRGSAWSRHRKHLEWFMESGKDFKPSSGQPVWDRKYDWQLDLKRNVGILELKESRPKIIEIPLHPFLGCLGVAPAFGRIEVSAAPGEYGGNMDCVETKEGTRVYLPVWVRGAYLAFGDVHAAQGDGEVCGVALETTAEVTIKLEIEASKSIEWPRLEDNNYIMTVGSGLPLLDCVRIAQTEMVKWLTTDYGFEKWEAYQVVSQLATMRIGNIVNPNYTVVAKFPKKYLPI